LDYAHEKGYNSFSSNYLKASSLYQLEKYNEAISYYNKSLSFNETDMSEDVYLGLGLSKYKLGDNSYIQDLQKAGPEGKVWLDKIKKNK